MGILTKHFEFYPETPKGFYIKGQAKVIKEYLCYEEEVNGNYQKEKVIYNIFKYDSIGCLIEKIDYSLDKRGSKTFYKYNSKGDLTEEINNDYDEEGHLKAIFRTIYDSRGNILEWQWLNPNGILRKTINYCVDYSGTGHEMNDFDGERSLFSIPTNNLENRNKEINRKHYDSEDKLCEISSTKYDNNGNEIEWCSFVPEGGIRFRWLYKYDAQGDLIEFSSFQRNGKLRFKWTIIYDEKGYEIERNQYDLLDQLYRKYTFLYDNNGRILECNEYSISEFKDRKELSLIYKCAYKYDKNYNIIQKCCIPYTYITESEEYDNVGNWTRRKEISIHSPSITIYEREIEYY